MITVIEGLTFAFVYIDDILIFSTTFGDHVKQVSEVVKRLNAYNLRLNAT